MVAPLRGQRFPLAVDHAGPDGKVALVVRQTSGDVAHFNRFGGNRLGLAGPLAQHFLGLLPELVGVGPDLLEFRSLEVVELLKVATL